MFLETMPLGICFSGAVTKYRTLDYVLNMISKTTDVAFAEKEGKIVIHVK